MIDVETENLINGSEATRDRLLRNRSTGKACHISQFYRYIQVGAVAVNGDRVRLETVKTPSGMMTSTEAISRFIRRLTEPTASVTAPTPSQRRQQIETAQAELASCGM